MLILLRKILLPILIGSLFAQSAVSDVISIRADEWFPFNGTPGSETPGYIIEIADGIFTEAGRLNQPVDVYIACSPNKPNSIVYTKLLSEGIVDLRKTGELQKTLEKYALKDWK